jgi:hypothetical protein
MVSQRLYQVVLSDLLSSSLPVRLRTCKKEGIEADSVVANLTVSELLSCKPNSLITTQDLLVLRMSEDARLHTLIRIADAIERWSNA